MADRCITEDQNELQWSKPLLSPTKGEKQRAIVNINWNSLTHDTRTTAPTAGSFEDLKAIFALNDSEMARVGVTSSAELERIYGSELVQLARVAATKRIAP